MSVPTRAELDAIVRERLSTDPGFREQLLADPHTVVSALAGIPLPPQVRVTVHEESLTDVHLVVPAATDNELDEADLELVAGGGMCWEHTCQCGAACTV